MRTVMLRRLKDTRGHKVDRALSCEYGLLANVCRRRQPTAVCLLPAAYYL